MWGGCEEGVAAWGRWWLWWWWWWYWGWLPGGDGCGGGGRIGNGDGCLRVMVAGVESFVSVTVCVHMYIYRYIYMYICKNISIPLYQSRESELWWMWEGVVVRCGREGIWVGGGHSEKGVREKWSWCTRHVLHGAASTV